MMTLKVKENEYKISFGYNSFCDTDLMERTADLLKLVQGAGVGDDKDVASMGKFKELFSCVRELFFVGLKKHNPVETLQDVGDILDDYHDEATKEDKRGILDLFTKLTEELMNEGFLGDLLKTAEAEQSEKVVKMPQDHKKS